VSKGYAAVIPSCRFYTITTAWVITVQAASIPCGRDIVPGVPVVNPLWNSSCPVTNTCEPFVNPAAFERPPLGQIGNAPRTIDGARGPWQQYLDLSIQKTFSIHEGKIRVQFRTDLLNALNHPVFGLPTGYGGSNSWDQNSTPPSTAPITAAQFDTWRSSITSPCRLRPKAPRYWARCKD